MMTRSDVYFESQGGGTIHASVWMPEEEPKAVLQIVHGIAEYVDRYDAFAKELCGYGFVVVGEDHMGHGKSVGSQPLGYFNGGWHTAVADTYHLLRDTRANFPMLPYVLFGHSMGSFMTRTLLIEYPDSGISAAILSGTGWEARPVLLLGNGLCSLSCRINGENTVDTRLHKLVFGSYNKKVEHPKTAYDWLSRDSRAVGKYVEDPLCGFTPTVGLLRDMMRGMMYNEKPENLGRMKMDLPVLFVAGGDDPVGAYGKGVQKCAQAFKNAGMTDITSRIFPLCRHEILNEINRREIIDFILRWIADRIPLK